MTYIVPESHRVAHASQRTTTTHTQSLRSTNYNLNGGLDGAAAAPMVDGAAAASMVDGASAAAAVHHSFEWYRSVCVVVLFAIGFYFLLILFVYGCWGIPNSIGYLLSARARGGCVSPRHPSGSRTLTSPTVFFSSQTEIVGRVKNRINFKIS